MSSLSIDKLCLGTAQFGLNYGISNKKGKVPVDEVFRIMDYAYDKGVDTLDTGHAYGNSENIIKKYLAGTDNTFRVISKMPELNKKDKPDIRPLFQDTLKRLGRDRIYGYLAHGINDLRFYKRALWDQFASLKSEGIVEKIGVSIYNPKELDFLLDSNFVFDIIQLPYSMFDQRFKGYFPDLKKRNIDIYARSVFLQGLCFMNVSQLDSKFRSAACKLAEVQAASIEYDIPVPSLCVLFAALNDNIDKIIIGVDSLEHLKQNVGSFDYIEKTRVIYKLLESLEIHDENVILPYNWKK